MIDLTADELKPRLVLHLDPAVLEDEGGQFFPPDERRVEGDHFFLCVALEDDHSYWVPLSSKAQPGRVRIAGTQKSGQPSWTRQDTYAVATSYCRASFSVVVAGATSALDQTRKGERNMVSDEALKQVEYALRLAPY